MQPTDIQVRSVFVFPRTRGREEEHCGSRERNQELVVGAKSEQDLPMRDRTLRLVVAIAAVLAIAAAGGGSLQGF